LWYKAGQLLEGLLGQQDVEVLLLAADLLVDVGVVDELTPMCNETTKRLRGLAALSDDWRTSAHPDPVVRNRAATLLGRLDADVDRLCRDPGQADYWAARIEPGTFSMGQDRDKTIETADGEQGVGAYDDEAPQFTYHIRHPYAIGRFPVTNQQYLTFLEALDARNTPAAQQLWELMQHQEIPYPRSWPERRRYRSGEGNHPVAGVTWYAATAFAWWAHETFLTPEQRAAGESIRLPTEAEWERAAAYPLVLPGGDPRVGRREYPWGGSVAASKSDRVESSIQANINTSGIEGTSVVGIFPHGVADCGAEELAGNVWEWCSTPKLDYPFSGEVRAESLYSGEQRESIPYVLRGGSWYDKRDFARGASRHEDKVDDSHRGHDATGLRLARLFPLP
jgi:formylglycine-generating enzyme required for sulfatase activity